MFSSTKNTILLGTALIILFFLFLERSIVVPFILAAIFAYIFNPVVDFLSSKTHLPRVISVLLIYLAVIGVTLTTFIYISGVLLKETNQLISETKETNIFDAGQLDSLPHWEVGGQKFGLKMVVVESTNTLRKEADNLQNNLWPFFSGAANKLIAVLIFLIATFYFLKDGRKLFTFIEKYLSEKQKESWEELLRRINRVLGSYLRGQVLLVLIMTTISFIFLTFLGIKFALVLAIVTGFLELIPYFGPIVATTLVTATAFLTGTSRFGFDPVTSASLVILGYVLFRQFEDYFVIPQVLSRVTELHPLVVLFSTLAGGHLAGPVGFVLAVPIVATARVAILFALEKTK
ncbi:MAG: AI-2E family transporter [Patescibacteria group bacterium]|nr:AI-2E family transporter [Patescibacteria group bacterium]